MKESTELQSTMDRALAFAHAALEQCTPEFIIIAMRETKAALARLRHSHALPLALGDAHGLIERLGHLRAVLGLLERRLLGVGYAS